jgi:hypothetical protein
MLNTISETIQPTLPQVSDRYGYVSVTGIDLSLHNKGLRMNIRNHRAISVTIGREE